MLPKQVGGIIPRSYNKGSLVQTGEVSSHKCIRISGSKISPIEFPQKQERAIQFQIDNTTALRYLTKMGGVKSLEMIKLSKEIWDNLLSRGITITTK